MYAYVQEVYSKHIKCIHVHTVNLLIIHELWYISIQTFRNSGGNMFLFADFLWKLEPFCEIGVHLTTFLGRLHT